MAFNYTVFDRIMFETNRIRLLPLLTSPKIGIELSKTRMNFYCQGQRSSAQMLHCNFLR